MRLMPAPVPTRSPAKQLTPLWVISLFVSLTEAVLGISATKTAGGVQVALTAFVIAFPVLIAGAFFAVLWSKAYVFYPPSEYAKVDIRKYVEALRGGQGLVTKTSDLKGSVLVFGRPDRFKLLFKASGPNWTRSTKAMEVPGGCLVQVSTSLITSVGESGAEAVSYIPGAVIQDEPDGNGCFLADADVSSRQ
jgi:hypothetical protein